MKKYRLKNLDCAACAAKIENGVSKLAEVNFVSVNFAGSSMTIVTTDIEKVKNKIRDLEPDVTVEESDKNNWIISGDEINENRREIIRALIALILLVAGLVFRNKLHASASEIPEYLVFVTAWMISGWHIITGAMKNIVRGRVFDEKFLMTIATLGAFAIHEMPEGVAVMLFYVVGELFQDIAVGRSRRSIKSMLEIKPDYAIVLRNNEQVRVSPESVSVGETIIVKAGEKIPLDGVVLEGNSFVNTSALTGESVPRMIKEESPVLSGMINQSGLLKIKTTRTFGESSVSKILDLVENASSKKAETEKFITTFAKYYTPFVVFGAVLLAVLPPLLFTGATFSEWVYRALVVLVISCPCALVISIPLGYFGGIGAASKKGILIKGSNFLDALTQIKTVVFDKTGTLTKGEFRVSEIVLANGYPKEELLKYASYAEATSNHPIAKSITEAYGKEIDRHQIGQSREISGNGIKTIVANKTVIAGNDSLLHKENIDHPECITDGTIVHVAIDKNYAGYLVISDRLKEDAEQAVMALHKKNIRIIMLTGDSHHAAETLSRKLNIDEYFAELLPQDKVRYLEKFITQNAGAKTAFVGDGINDGPVLARADVGIAMGAMGSDAAIDIADVVLITDSPMKVSEAIDIARKTRRIIWQNIIFALGIKLLFIALGVAGIATMWQAVFGDMGVALIAVFNAIRILK